MTSFWMVRAGEGGYLIGDFEKKRCVAVGWNSLGDLSKVGTPEELVRLFDATYPDEKPGARGSYLAAITKFRFTMNRGDAVVSYDPMNREYVLGEISGDYAYDERRVPDYFHVRSVTWKGRIKRDGLSPQSKNPLGALQCVTQPGEEVLKELTAVLGGKTAPPEVEQEDSDVIYRDLKNKAHEFIKDRIAKLDWEEMQQTVAALLRAMGYKTEVSSGGPDRGKDVTASPDGLGLQEPRIKAEVKHQLGQIGASDVRSFIGGLRPGDKGLYVSTGGFSKEARYEAERSNVPVTLVDLDRLAKLLVENYDKVDSDGRALVPLIRLFWPAS